MLAAASILECSSTVVTFCSHCFSFGVVGQSLSSTLLSWPSSWEKLNRKLARLVMTLIKRVVAGPVGGGGGNIGIAVAVAATAQRAAAGEAWWAAAHIFERSIAFGPRRRGRRLRPPVAPGWPGAWGEPGWCPGCCRDSPWGWGWSDKNWQRAGLTQLYLYVAFWESVTILRA